MEENNVQAVQTATTMQDGNQQQATQQTTEPETNKPSSWYSNFEGEELGYIQNKGWNTDDGYKKLFDSYRNLEKMRGVPPERLIKLPDGQDGWDEVYSKLGKPDAVEGYKFEAQEGQEFDENRLNWFNETAYELNLSKQQHNNLVKKAYEYEQNMINQLEEAAEKQRVADLEKLKSDWGAGFEERLELARQATRAFVTDDSLLDKLGDSLNSHADVVRIFAKIGESISEDKLPTNDGRPSFGYTKEQAISDMKKLKEEVMADKFRLAKYNEYVGEDVAKMEQLRKLIYG